MSLVQTYNEENLHHGHTGFDDEFYRRLGKSLEEMLGMDDEKIKEQKKHLKTFAKAVTKKIKEKNHGIEIIIDAKTKIQFRLRLNSKPEKLCYSCDGFKNDSLFFENFTENEIPQTIKKLINLIRGKKITYHLIS